MILKNVIDLEKGQKFLNLENIFGHNIFIQADIEY